MIDVVLNVVIPDRAAVNIFYEDPAITPFDIILDNLGTAYRQDIDCRSLFSMPARKNLVPPSKPGVEVGIGDDR